MSEKEIVIRAENIHMKFCDPAPVQILRGVDFQAYRGEAVAIMGRSGEGKSTLLHILGTLETPTEGDVFVAGMKVNSSNQARIRNAHIGFVFQSFHLLDDFTVIDNILMPAAIQRRSVSLKSPSFLRAETLLEKVGLTRRADYLAKLLSGGEKQRIAIARALCNDPDVILADEPTGNLDSQTAAGIHEILLDFARENRKTLIVVTHNQELANLCDRRYMIHEGSLVPS